MSKLQRLGFIQGIDVDLKRVSNPMLSIDEGVVEPYANAGENTYYYEIIRALAKKYKQPTDRPYNELSQEFKDALIYGIGDTWVEFVSLIADSGYKEHRTEFGGRY